MSQYDPIGPGTEAWNASYRAIAHGIAGDALEKQAAIDEMTRHLIDHGASAQLISEWEAFIETRIANPEPEDYDLDLTQTP